MLAFTPLLLAVLPVAFSAPHSRSKEPTIIEFAGQFSCPSPLQPFHASTSTLLQGVSAEQAWAELGDFCAVEWQGFDIISTKGACNSHRSLRSYRTADLELSERLDFIHLPSSSPPPSIIPNFFARSSSTAPQVYAHGYTMLNRPKLAGADVIRMKSLLKVVETQAGAQVSWDVMGCSDYPEHLADKLDEVHEGALWEAEMRIMESKAQEGSTGMAGGMFQVMEQVLEVATLG